MTRGKIFEPINDTPENIAKAMFRNDRLRKQKLQEQARNKKGKTAKNKAIDKGD